MHTISYIYTYTYKCIFYNIYINTQFCILLFKISILWEAVPNVSVCSFSLFLINGDSFPLQSHTVTLLVIPLFIVLGMIL